MIACGPLLFYKICAGRYQALGPCSVYTCEKIGECAWQVHEKTALGVKLIAECESLECAMRVCEMRKDGRA